MYGSECWTISSEMEKKVEAMEMWCYRRTLRLSWTKKVTNEEVLKRIGKERTLMKRIRKRQLEFLGHIMREEKLEDLTVTGKMEGKRSRGRQRSTFMEGLSSWLAKQVPARRKTQITKQALLSTTKDRERWRSPIAYHIK